MVLNRELFSFHLPLFSHYLPNHVRSLLTPLLFGLLSLTLFRSELKVARYSLAVLHHSSLALGLAA